MLILENTVETIESKIVCEMVRGSREHERIYERHFSVDKGGTAFSINVYVYLHKPINVTYRYNYAIIFKVKTNQIDANTVYFLMSDYFAEALQLLDEHALHLFKTLRDTEGDETGNET